MSRYEFKVGDRVRIRSWDDMRKEFGGTTACINVPYSFTKNMRPLCGAVATIKEIRGDIVELGGWSTKADTYWNFTAGMLEPAFIVGRCYQLHDGSDTRNDNIIKVAASSETRFSYETVRGGDNFDSAKNNSRFANCLVPLYGKQVGEAIRKWDAKHGKAKVREVKRHAKAGEYIKIVEPHVTGNCYKHGDVLRVFERTSNLNGVYAFTKKMHPCCSADTDEPTSWIADSEYVVLEGYKPEHKDKHAYDEYEIVDAKKCCDEMMIEFLDSCTNGGIDFIKNSNPAKTSCLITDDDGMKSGSAICNSDDEFNSWIGRCVALCKALHKPIPNFILEGGK